jgi:hypothetical protein
MGFKDKAKQLAEQAQAKLDEAQQQFNQQPEQPSGPAVEYDEHGRPVPTSDPSPPHGDPVAPPPAPGVPDAGAAPPAEAPPGASGPPPAPGVPPVQGPSGDDEYAPPSVTKGDPLAG